jgi:phospholipase C
MRKLLLLAAALVLAALPAVPAAAAPADDAPTTTPIQHVVWMMQDNHSFDNYFGTYPGADGIPSGVCQRLNLNRQSTRGCVQPFRIGDTPIEDLSQGPGVQRRQENGGRMDGFVAAYRRLGLDGTSAMGYYDGADIPFHWNVADQYVLFDRFFSSTKVGSREAYLYWVAGNAPAGQTPLRSSAGYDDLPTIFDRLADQGISARFYVENLDKAATSGESRVSRSSQLVKVPLLSMKRFRDGGEYAGQVVDLSQYYLDLRNGTLPAVSYIVTTSSSENPPAGPNAGSRTLRKVTTELMKSSAWSASALMWTYDGWGGWYDHVAPPKVDSRGYGFRVPALLVSPYAKRGVVDHTVLDYTSMLHFIETNWKLAPLSSRDKQSAGLASAFDFTAAPRPANSLPWTWPAPEVRAATHSPAPVIYSVYGLAVALAIAIVALAVRRRPLPVPVTRAAVLLRSRLESLPDRLKRFLPVSRSMPSTPAPSPAILPVADSTERPATGRDSGRSFLTLPGGHRPTPVRAAKDRLTKWYRGKDKSSGKEAQPSATADAAAKSAIHVEPATTADTQTKAQPTTADTQTKAQPTTTEAEPATATTTDADAEAEAATQAELAATADAPTEAQPTTADADPTTENEPATTTDADADWPVAWWIGAPLPPSEARLATTTDADAEWPVAWWIGAPLPPTEVRPATTTDAESAIETEAAATTDTRAEPETEAEPATATEAERPATPAPVAPLADDERTKHQRRRNQSRTQRRKASRHRSRK